ncbi:hypothetical protein BC940DRAFT_352597, partial [Gongronella butleri]
EGLACPLILKKDGTSSVVNPVIRVTVLIECFQFASNTNVIPILAGHPTMRVLCQNIVINMSNVDNILAQLYHEFLLFQRDSCRWRRQLRLVRVNTKYDLDIQTAPVPIDETNDIKRRLLDHDDSQSVQVNKRRVLEEPNVSSLRVLGTNGANLTRIIYASIFAHELLGEKGKRLSILITDGAIQTSTEDCTMLQQLAEQNIVFHAVQVTAAHSFVPGHNFGFIPNNDILKYMTTATGGTHTFADQQARLKRPQFVVDLMRSNKIINLHHTIPASELKIPSFLNSYQQKYLLNQSTGKNHEIFNRAVPLASSENENIHNFPWDPTSRPPIVEWRLIKYKEYAIIAPLELILSARSREGFQMDRIWLSKSIDQPSAVSNQVNLTVTLHWHPCVIIEYRVKGSLAAANEDQPHESICRRLKNIHAEIVVRGEGEFAHILQNWTYFRKQLQLHLMATGKNTRENQASRADVLGKIERLVATLLRIYDGDETLNNHWQNIKEEPIPDYFIATPLAAKTKDIKKNIGLACKLWKKRQQRSWFDFETFGILFAFNDKPLREDMSILEQFLCASWAHIQYQGDNGEISFTRVEAHLKYDGDTSFCNAKIHIDYYPRWHISRLITFEFVKSSTTSMENTANQATEKLKSDEQYVLTLQEADLINVPELLAASPYLLYVYRLPNLDSDENESLGFAPTFYKHLSVLLAEKFQYINVIQADADSQLWYNIFKHLVLIGVKQSANPSYYLCRTSDESVTILMTSFERHNLAFQPFCVFECTRQATTHLSPLTMAANVANNPSTDLEKNGHLPFDPIALTFHDYIDVTHACSPEKVYMGEHVQSIHNQSSIMLVSQSQLLAQLTALYAKSFIQVMYTSILANTRPYSLDIDQTLASCDELVIKLDMTEYIYAMALQQCEKSGPFSAVETTWEKTLEYHFTRIQTQSKQSQDSQRAQVYVYNGRKAPNKELGRPLFLNFSCTYSPRLPRSSASDVTKTLSAKLQTVPLSKPLASIEAMQEILLNVSDEPSVNYELFQDAIADNNASPLHASRILLNLVFKVTPAQDHILAKNAKKSDFEEYLAKNQCLAVIETKEMISWLLTEYMISGLIRHNKNLTETMLKFIEQKLNKCSCYNKNYNRFSVPLHLIKSNQHGIFLQQLEQDVNGFCLTRLDNLLHAADIAGEQMFLVLMRVHHHHVDVHILFSPFNIEINEIERPDNIQVIDKLKAVEKRANQLMLLKQLQSSRVSSVYLVACPELLSSSDENGQSADESFSVETRRFLPGQFACPIVHIAEFPLHWRVSPEKAMNHLKTNVLRPFAVQNIPGMFVIERENSIVYFTLSSSGKNTPALPLVPGNPKLGNAHSIVLQVHGLSCPIWIENDFIPLIKAKLDSEVTLEEMQAFFSRNPDAKLTLADADYLLPMNTDCNISHTLSVSSIVTDPLKLLKFFKSSISGHHIKPMAGSGILEALRIKYSSASNLGHDKQAFNYESSFYSFYYNCIQRTLKSSPLAIKCGCGMAGVLISVLNDHGQLVDLGGYQSFPLSVDLEAIKRYLSSDLLQIDQSNAICQLKIEIWTMGDVNAEELLKYIESSFRHSICDYFIEQVVSLNLGSILSSEFAALQNAVEYLGRPPLTFRLGTMVRKKIIDMVLYLLQLSDDWGNPTVQTIDIRSETVTPWFMSSFVSCLEDNLTGPFMPTITWRKADDIKNHDSDWLPYNTRAFASNKLQNIEFMAICGLKELVQQFGSPIYGSNMRRRVSTFSNRSIQTDHQVHSPQNSASQVQSVSVSPSILSSDGQLGPSQDIHIRNNNEKPCFLILHVTANRIRAHSFNWRERPRQAIFSAIQQNAQWQASRISVLRNILHQKMGLFHHATPIYREIEIWKNDNNATQSGSSNAHTAIVLHELIHKTSPETERTDTTEETLLNVNVGLDKVLWDSIARLRTKHCDVLQRHGSSFLSIHLQKAYLQSVHKNALSTYTRWRHSCMTLRPETNAMARNEVSIMLQSSRLLHFCRAPFVFQFLQTSSLETNVQNLLLSFVQSYCDYLQMINLQPIRFKPSDTPDQRSNLMSNSFVFDAGYGCLVSHPPTYVFEITPTDSIIVEIGFMQTLVSVSMYGLHWNDQTQKRSKSEQRQIFQQREHIVQTLKHYIHIHSFVYDFHLKFVRDHLSTSKPPIDVFGTLQRLSSVHQYPPVYSMNRLIHGVYTVETNYDVKLIHKILVSEAQRFGMARIHSISQNGADISGVAVTTCSVAFDSTTTSDAQLTFSLILQPKSTIEATNVLCVNFYIMVVTNQKRSPVIYDSLNSGSHDTNIIASAQRKIDSVVMAVIADY